jgi:phospholipase C
MKRISIWLILILLSELVWAQSPIQHWVVIYMENRSFDHLFGTYPGVNGLTLVGGVPSADCNGKGIIPLQHLNPE